jgi:hypothetical protein
MNDIHAMNGKKRLGWLKETNPTRNKEDGKKEIMFLHLHCLLCEMNGWMTRIFQEK